MIFGNPETLQSIPGTVTSRLQLQLASLTCAVIFLNHLNEVNTYSSVSSTPVYNQIAPTVSDMLFFLDGLFE